MRKALGFALALTLALSLPALAEETKGTVKSVDPSGQSFILEGGTQLWMSEGQVIELSPGEKVLATHEMKDGKNVVIELERRTTSPDGQDTTNFGSLGGPGYEIDPQGD